MITVDFNRLDIKSGDRILDIGCGTGRHTCEIFTRGAVAVGVDRCFEDLRKTRDSLVSWEEYGKEKGIWGILSGDITQLPFADNFFDLVICSEVLEHIKDSRKAMAEIVRVLKPGKDLVVSVPRFFPECVCWVLSKSYYQAEGGHIRIYKEKELINELESEGVRKWAKHFAHSLHTPYWWLKCLLGPNRDDLVMVNLYHRLLVWDIMHQPWLTKFSDKILNPVLGKSLVLYLRKEK
ncbi:MAG: class I SAM-dependent methyltransferase [Desulfobacterales bacterium]|nr:class I SAM-dependent methyltransferase [Desulfobacterales bacterium]